MSLVKPSARGWGRQRRPSRVLPRKGREGKVDVGLKMGKHTPSSWEQSWGGAMNGAPLAWARGSRKSWVSDTDLATCSRGFWLCTGTIWFKVPRLPPAAVPPQASLWGMKTAGSLGQVARSTSNRITPLAWIPCLEDWPVTPGHTLWATNPTLAAFLLNLPGPPSPTASWVTPRSCSTSLDLFVQC